MTRSNFRSVPFLALITLFFLSGCSLLPSNNPDELDQLNHWQVRGKLSVSNGKEAITGYLSWDQKYQDYDLFISGPLGQGSTRLTGDNKKASLTLPNKPAVTASSARQLMKQYMGWDFPVEDLKYWVKAQPSPTAAFKEKRDGSGLLNTLEQYGWDITYSRYSRQGTHWLPGRIKLVRTDEQGRYFKFIFATKEWTIYD